MTRFVCTTILGLAAAAALWAGAWTPPVEVRLDSTLCAKYRVRLSGEYLVVEVALQPGWHTFAMDNKKRAEEKLAGKRSLGIEKPTEIAVSGGLQVGGPWFQTPPKDASRPELNWFTWIYDRQALFVAKVRPSGSAPARIGVRAQACTESSCKNVDIQITLPTRGAGRADVDLASLVQVR
jgi:hypothetical protein